ncbi:Peptidoglycan/xylan/chitin deacetylase, PgdA/CDA1 family [Atopostipes suicloacalis DSM 15692]|uniref:Peptidoglycan/xylan/chitin deacetylase, PgdA/CDA1 family n=1 Tax=Atopostipes suicloacalis DSM 15692 TaxID=1121025 RepID=A0A1M4TWK0_9LACT|nr:polysaccharide deacetylase family protein [Atopostipes suicloacalis]SHE48855.1 Peptidoglycan/xylan/chitin deacetylase, PgdA/CDA1 family [Atopostipes suicloacalis DSM 15692]
MKNKIYSSLVLSAFLLAGCNNETSAPENSEPEQNNEDTTEQVADDNTDDTETDEETDETEHEESEDEELTYQYKINPNTFSVEPIDSENSNEDEKLVLLTFDDAPYGNTIEIAEALEEKDVKALFFINGMYMEDEEGFETIQKVHDMGFEIGNHTHTHAKLDDYSEDEQREEIIKTNDIIEEAIGEKPRFFRAPHGVMTDYAKQVMEEEDMTWMNWSFGYDWESEYQNSAALIDITLNTEFLSPGANILMHDREWTAEAVPEIVDGLIEKGYTIVDPKLIQNEAE